MNGLQPDEERNDLENRLGNTLQYYLKSLYSRMKLSGAFWKAF